MTSPQEEFEQPIDAQPLVSIVLPVYNSAEELRSAFAELDKQTYRNREIIIVDDGSTDQTSMIAGELAAGRDDVLPVRTEHKGASSARNAGAERAKGETIFFAESDCVYDDTYLQKAVDSLNSHPAAGAVCLTGAPLIARSTLATECIDVENKMQHILLRQGKIKPFYAWVYRRDALRKLGGFDERLFQGEDKDLFARLNKSAYSVAWVPGINWRHRRNQTTAELAGKWFPRGRTRALYSLKNRRASDFVRTLAPLWLTILGIALLFVSPILGIACLLLVAALFVGNTVRVMRTTWSEIQKKRIFLGYPFFTLTRNFTMGAGYSVGLVMILARKVQGKEIRWDNV